MRITQHHRAGHTIRVRTAKLAEAIVDEQYRRRPDLVARYGPAGREKCVQDTKYHLRFLSASVEFGQPRVFADYCDWAVGVMEAHRVDARDAVENLRLFGPVLAEHVPPDAAALAGEHLDAAIARLTSRPGASTGESAPSRF